MMGQPYVFGSDSSLMSDVLSKIKRGDSFLEIGVGNGGNLRVVKSKFELIVGTDIIELKRVKRENQFAELIVADRATCFRESTFDYIAFNPPYVPSPSIRDHAVDGGPTGVEIPLEFLKSALDVLKKNGIILLLLSSESNLMRVKEFCRDHSISFKRKGMKKLFFESLQIFELRILARS